MHAMTGGARRAAVQWTFAAAILLAAAPLVSAQSFSVSNLNLNGSGVSQGTSLMFGPDGRLYVLQLKGEIDIFEIERTGIDQYNVVAAEQLNDVKNVPNHDDDGSSNAGNNREATGITVVGTASNPVIYATSSDSRVGGPSGDKDLDTNSGVITRIEWVGVDLDDPAGEWVTTDIVRGLPRSEENHATNGLEFVTIGGTDYLIVAQGGHANAGSPSNNFAWQTEYALSAAVLAVNLSQLEGLPILNDGVRDYIYDLPTVDDPTRANANGIEDPNAMGYDGVDLNDPWGGNDGLNQAKLVPGGPVQIFSPGYRNTYDLVVTESGAVYVTDNGANGGWGGYPENEGPGGNVTNNFRPGEPGSTGSDNGEAGVNNDDHLTLVTTDIQSYVFGSFYGGHPTPIRANPAGAGLFTRGVHSSDPGDSNGNTYTDDWFRTVNFDPSLGGDAADPMRALPADWPPVPIPLANPVEGDFRNPGGFNPDGPNDSIVTVWQNNSNGIDEYTASNFGGAMQGDLVAGRNGGGNLHRVQLEADGSLQQLQTNWISGLGGNALGITCNGDADPFPGTIWVATFNGNIKVLEPQDFVICLLPGDAGYDPLADNDFDGYTNADEIDNVSDICNGGSQPNDFDSAAGGTLVSDLNDLDDDNDGILDANDVLQLGDPTTGGSDAFAIPVVNELFSDSPVLGGYLGLGITGFMNNGDPNPNWLDWLDVLDAGPNTNDILGGAVGAITMQMTAGTAVGLANDQDKGFQYGVDVDLSTGGFRVESRMLNFSQGFQLYPFTGASGPGELGIQMGDGTQSNFVQFVVDATGVKVVEEVGDVPTIVLSQAIPLGDRPSQSLTFRLDVDSATGDVAAAFEVNGGGFQGLGTFTLAPGAVLDAVQQASNPIVVGVIGSSQSLNDEVEGTWDYLNVVGRQPAIQAPIPSLEEPLAGAPSLSIDLDAFFQDDDGDANLTYTLVSIADPDFPTSLVGSALTIGLPGFVGQTTITVRATDATGLFIEQSFTVSVTDPTPLYRVNCGGPLVAAIDGGPDWEADTAANNSPYLLNPGGNNVNGFAMNSFTPEVDLSTTPTTIYTTERWDSPAPPSMVWGFPVPSAGTYEVRLYVGNGFGGTSAPGQRVYTVLIEGDATPATTNIDLSANFGHQVGSVITEFVEVTDGLLEIEFIHNVENPLVNGIEIIGGGGSTEIPVQVAQVADQLSGEGETINLPVLASGGDTPGSYSFEATGLPPGIQIEPTTGLIFGTVAAGAFVGVPYSVTVVVDDNDANLGDFVQINFTWEILDPALITWTDKNENESYTGRHECAFVQAGDKFFLFGGRENPQTVDTYDHATDTWTQSAPAPQPFNHCQAVEYEGLVWVIFAFDDNAFPNESNAESVWIYDPANDVWGEGPAIPVARQRGGGGVVQHEGKFYCVGGNTQGHNGGYVPWFDEFDPETGEWTTLPDAPRARDSFHAAVIDGKLYAAGGRLTGGPGGTFAPLVAEVDVYDFQTGTWSTLPSSSNLPTPRGGSTAAVLGSQLLVLGGEGGGQAFDSVEALDTTTNTWETLPSMNFPRHGFQVINSGGNLFTTAGSPNQGGGNQKNMEVYGDDAIAGAASTSGELQLSVSGPLVDENPVTLTLDHVGGNTGIAVESIALTGADAADFALDPASTGFFLLPVGSSRSFLVEYVGTADDAQVTVDVTTSAGVFSTTVVWDPPLIPVVDVFGATVPTITQGEETTIQWSVSSATSVDITNVGVGLSTSGSTTVMPLSTTTYDLTAFGLDGTASGSLTITVEPAPAPVVQSFVAADSPIFEGQMTTLSWSVSDSISVDITNVGAGLPPTGNAIVSPLVSTTYDLTANGFNGSATGQVTIDVLPPPPAPILIQYSASSTAIFEGQDATISWNVLNADSVDITNLGTGLPSSGSAVVSPVVTTTYQLSGSNFSGATSANLTITVDPAPPAPIVNQFASIESQISVGESVTIQWSVSDVPSVDITNIGTGLPAVGSAVLSPTAATTYMLTASNFTGNTTASLTVDVLAPPVVDSFLAADPTIDSGQSTTLSWTTSNATFVDIPGVGTSLPANGSALVSPGMTTTYDLTAFGPDGSSIASITVTVEFPPVVDAFTATDPQINAGDSTTLSWSVSNATSVDITGVGTGLAPIGSQSVSPVVSTSYTLTATGPDGTATASLTIDVDFPSTIDSFVAANPTITIGEQTTLTWMTTNATSVSITGVGSSLVPDGSVTVAPAVTTTYDLTAIGPDGSSMASATITVLVPPVVGSFAATDSTITSGETTMLSWSTSNATSVDIPGVGAGLPPTGSASVSPVITTTYDLTANGPDGTAMASTTITVLQPPVVDSFLAADPTITIGDSTLVSWSVLNATSVDITGVGTALPATGSASVSPVATTVYDLTATGPEGVTTADLTIVVLVPPVVDSFVATESMIFVGETSELSWTVSNATSVDIVGVGTGLPTTGSATVMPARTTTYDLTATGPDGTATSSVTVTVDEVPPPEFLRGDVSDDGGIGLVDAIDALNFLFGGNEIACPATVDFDANGSPGLGDVVSLLQFLFSAGAPPAAPYPDCGPSLLPSDATEPCMTSCTPGS